LVILAALSERNSPFTRLKNRSYCQGIPELNQETALPAHLIHCLLFRASRERYGKVALRGAGFARRPAREVGNPNAKVLRLQRQPPVADDADELLAKRPQA
jgi:hypothetical protein